MVASRSNRAGSSTPIYRWGHAFEQCRAKNRRCYVTRYRVAPRCGRRMLPSLPRHSMNPSAPIRAGIWGWPDVFLHEHEHEHERYGTSTPSYTRKDLSSLDRDRRRGQARHANHLEGAVDGWSGVWAPSRRFQHWEHGTRARTRTHSHGPCSSSRSTITPIKPPPRIPASADTSGAR